MADRNLYLKTLSVEEAYDKYLDVLNSKNILKTNTEVINTEDSLNRITSKAVYANCNSPLFSASAMDGICIESKKTKSASPENPVILKLNSDYVVVDTGDVIKPPYDAVIMAEDVIVIDDESVKITEPVPSWQHVRPIGEDIVKNEMVLASNHKITPIDIGAMLASGNLTVECIKNISVGVIPTGDEIINPKAVPVDDNPLSRHFGHNGIFRLAGLLWLVRPFFRRVSKGMFRNGYPICDLNCRPVCLPPESIIADMLDT